jgi:hypothetical protein
MVGNPYACDGDAITATTTLTFVNILLLSAASYTWGGTRQTTGTIQTGVLVVL